jgi:hypothetical protein
MPARSQPCHRRSEMDPFTDDNRTHLIVDLPGLPAIYGPTRPSLFSSGTPSREDCIRSFSSLELSEQRGNDAKTSLPYLPPLVQSRSSAWRAPENLRRSPLQKGMAPEEVCPVEQEEHRVFQGQLSAEETGRS